MPTPRLKSPPLPAGRPAHQPLPHAQQTHDRQADPQVRHVGPAKLHLSPIYWYSHTTRISLEFSYINLAFWAN